MLKGFKDFLLRGNVLDLAVAVVVGTAFTAIVTAFTTYVIEPLIAALGGDNELGWGFQIVADNPATFVNVGAVITAAINFIIIAAVVYFVLILPANAAKKKFVSEEADKEASAEDLLIQIRDILEAQAGQPGQGGAHTRPTPSPLALGHEKGWAHSDSEWAQPCGAIRQLPDVYLDGPDLTVGGDVVAVRGDRADERTHLDSAEDAGGGAVDVGELNGLEVTVELALGDDELLDARSRGQLELGVCLREDVGDRSGRIGEFDLEAGGGVGDADGAVDAAGPCELVTELEGGALRVGCALTEDVGGAAAVVEELTVERAAAERRGALDEGVFLRHDDLEAVGDDAVLIVDLGRSGTRGTEDQTENGGTGHSGVTGGLEATRLDSHDYSVFGGGYYWWDGQCRTQRVQTWP